MDVRPVYWILCGAGATLLSSAWASKPVTDSLQFQDVKVSARQAVQPLAAEKSGLLLRRSPWSEAKSDPFSHSISVESKGVSLAVEAQAAPQPPVFPYVFIGKLSAEEKNVVFLSRSNQIYSVAAGDTLEGVYKIERVTNDALEITHLPDHKKLTFSFDTLAANKPAQTAIAQADTTPAPHASAPVKSVPEGMVGEVPSVENGQMTDDLKKMLSPAPPPQGDVLKMMGATPPPQGDALKIMTAPQAGSGAVSVPPTAPAAMPGQ